MGNLGHVLTNRAGAAVSGVGLDRLPETLINVLSAGVSVSVAGGRRVLAPLDPFSEPVTTYTPRTNKNPASAPATAEGGAATRNSNGIVANTIESRRAREEMEEVERLREEMDAIIAGSCPMCEGSLADLNKSFLSTSSNNNTRKGGKPSSGLSQADRLALANEEEEWAL